VTKQVARLWQAIFRHRWAVCIYDDTTEKILSTHRSMTAAYEEVDALVWVQSFKERHGYYKNYYVRSIT
jgi:hypothetical protein